MNHSNYSSNNTIESINLINYSSNHSPKVDTSDLFEYETDKPKYLTNEEKLICSKTKNKDKSEKISKSIDSPTKWNSFIMSFSNLPKTFVLELNI